MESKKAVRLYRFAKMLVGDGDLAYEWIDGWARLPDTEAARAAWPHHGIVATPRGEIVTFHPAEPRLLAFDLDVERLCHEPALTRSTAGESGKGGQPRKSSCSEAPGNTA